MTRLQTATPRQHGFTLAELMAVVVIVGILATLATVGVRKYVLSSKGAEAVHMIGSIKAAEEAYRDETFTYLDVTGGALGADSSLYPQGQLPQSGRKWAWGIHSNEAVVFGYACKAGSGTVNVDPGTETSMNWPASSGPWYVVRAVADHNPGGKKAIFVSSSFTNQVYSENEDD